MPQLIKWLNNVLQAYAAARLSNSAKRVTRSIRSLRYI